MPEKDDDTSRLTATSFYLHGTGTLHFRDEYSRLRELVGEIVVGKNSAYQSAYVKVVSQGKHYLMPLRSVEKIKWDAKPQEQHGLL